MYILKLNIFLCQIHDEQDRSVADWFVQNPEASQALDDEEVSMNQMPS